MNMTVIISTVTTSNKLLPSVKSGERNALLITLVSLVVNSFPVEYIAFELVA